MNNNYKTITILLLASLAFGGTIELVPSDKEYSSYLKNVKKSYKIGKNQIVIKNIQPIYNKDSSALLYVIGREKEAKVCCIRSNDTTTINLKNIYVLDKIEWKSKELIYLKVWLGRIFWYELYWNTKDNKEQTIKLFLEKPENQ
jgi:hypothetical protein